MRVGSSDAKSWGGAALPPEFPSTDATLAVISGRASTNAFVRAVALFMRSLISSEIVKTSRKISVA